MGESLPDSLDELLLGDPLEVFGQDIISKHMGESEKFEYGESESPDSKDNVVKVKEEGSLDVKTEKLCKYCNFSAPKRALMKHMRTHMEKKFKCSWCSKSFLAEQALLNHENAHLGIKPFDCEHCGMEFTTKGEMVRHIGYKHSRQRPHKCPWPYCSYRAVEFARLKRHQVVHTGERPFQCQHCSYAAPLKIHLKRHISHVHRGEQPYECDICHMRFTQQGSMAWHRKKHSGQRPVFKCPHCPSVLGREYDLRQHIIKLHTSDRLHQCRICRKIFGDPYSLKIHKRTHKGQKCLKCGLCNFATAVVKHLECHMRKHTKQKPFKCNDCGKNFRQKLGLKGHRQKKHNLNADSKPKECVCKDCGASFLRQGNLKNHVLKFHFDVPTLPSQNRDSTVVKVEFSGEVEEMQTVVTGNHAETKDFEEVEEDTLVAIEKGLLGSPIEKHKEAVVEHLEEMVESVSNQEMTWGEMEISFEDSSVQKLEEPSARLQDFAMDEMEDCILTLSDLPVIELHYDESDGVCGEDSGLGLIYNSSGEGEGLEEDIQEDPWMWQSEKEKDLATCFGFDEYFGLDDQDPLEI